MCKHVYIQLYMQCRQFNAKLVTIWILSGLARPFRICIDLDLRSCVASPTIADKLNHINSMIIFCCIASGNIRINGVVDGIDLSDNVMRTNRINTVTGAKTFTGGLMVVSDDIVVAEDKLVDGVDLSEWKQLAAIVTGDYTVSISIAIPEVVLQQNLL